MIRILIADDHPFVREGLRMLIECEDDMQVVAEASDGREAIAEFRATRPDVVVMDIHMPNCNGLEATAAICREFPDCRIIVFSTNVDSAYFSGAHDCGAMVYLPKETDPREIVETIRRTATLPRRTG